MSELNGNQLERVIRTLSRVEDDLSVPLLLSLTVVGKSPGISVSELATVTNTPQQSASRYVAILQGRYELPGGQTSALARGPLVSLEINASDPRKRALYLTARGKDRLRCLLADLFGKEQVK